MLVVSVVLEELEPFAEMVEAIKTRDAKQLLPYMSDSRTRKNRLEPLSPAIVNANWSIPSFDLGFHLHEVANLKLETLGKNIRHPFPAYALIFHHPVANEFAMVRLLVVRGVGASYKADCFTRFKSRNHPDGRIYSWGRMSVTLTLEDDEQQITCPDDDTSELEANQAILLWLRALELINTHRSTEEPSTPRLDALNAKVARPGTGKAPIPKTRVLLLSEDESGDGDSVGGGGGSSRSLHDRRGHWRVYRDGKRVWVREAKIHGGSEDGPRYRVSA